MPLRNQALFLRLCGLRLRSLCERQNNPLSPAVSELPRKRGEGSAPFSPSIIAKGATPQERSAIELLQRGDFFLRRRCKLGAFVCGGLSETHVDHGGMRNITRSQAGGCPGQSPKW